MLTYVKFLFKDKIIMSYIKNNIRNYNIEI